MATALDILLTRRSVVANNLGEPGPSDEELQQILMAASRVPDHKGLFPWRFVVFRGNAREAFGSILASACLAVETDCSDARLATEKNRFMRAPVVICVVSSIVRHVAVPEWEQILSAGAVCQNILNATASLGYSGQWITEWYAYNDDVIKALKLEEGERVAGFVYIGTAREKPAERKRPELERIVTYWQPLTS